MKAEGEAHDGNYEFKVVIVLSICFGLVGLDRYIINPLFPVMAKDLSLDYGDIGLISGALALTWGIAAIFSGRLADRIGAKAVLVPSVIAFSVLVAMSGLATGLLSLLLVRGLMGVAEGAFVPASIVATAQASKLTRIGMNIGLLQMSAPLFGLGLAPIAATQLLQVLPSWHWVFALVAVPGLVMAWFVRRVLIAERHFDRGRSSETAGASRPLAGWGTVARNPRVVANAIAMACWLSSLSTLAALLPNYLTDHLGLGLEAMGGVLSGLGLGGVIGLLVVPGLGDRFGYKAVGLVVVVVELVALLLLQRGSPDVAQLFALLFVIGFTGAGVTAITAGPLTGGAVEPSSAATATGVVVGFGEIVGGALTPALAGMAASVIGIEVIPVIAFVAITLGFVATGIGAREPDRWAATRPAELPLSH